MATPALAERFLDTRAGRIRYLEGGAGPVLFLCHGFLGSAENFEAWFESLLPVRTLVVPDLPGCGASPALTGLHTSAHLAAALEPLLDELGLDKPGAFDLGGLCLGGGVACALLARRPERVRSLIVHTPLLAPTLVRRRFHVQVGLMTAPGVYPAIAWLSHRRVVSDVYKRLLVEGGDVDAGAGEANFRNQLRADPRATREWLRDGLRRDDASLVLGRELPTLLIASESDRICDVAGLRALAGRHPQVELAVEKGGHGWTQASIAWQTGVLRRFLAAA
jgi:pimeloyl-ACP methyl ester carboxylesterase